MTLMLALLVAACWASSAQAQPKGVKGPFPRPSENDLYVLVTGADTELDCRGTFQRVEQLREE